MDTKLGQENADEWFYESFKRYNNLFMYELEAPIDTMELLDAANLCTTGMQSFSKKCEILQLGVPPKLLPKDIEDGLCKDRDFKIICGGYSSSRVLQIEPIESEKIVAAVQADQDGVGLFQLGDEERGVIREESRLELPKEAKSEDQKSTGVIASRSTNVIFCEEDGTFLSRWSLDSPEKPIYIKLEESKAVSKALYWDDHVVSLNASDGSVRLLDLRGDDAKKATVSVKCVESGLSSASFVLYSFDVKPDCNMIGICDTVGHFQLFDIRKPTEVFSQITIPGYAEAAVLNKKFNLRFQKLTVPAAAADDNTMIKFVISGFKEEIIPVYKCQKSGEILPIFTHDGHTKTVTNAMWHNITDNLLFSASADAVLHAWRYIENVH